MPFALLLVGALWWLEVSCHTSPPPHPQPLWPEAGARGESAVREFLRGVLLALPYLCRSVGAVVVPVGLLLLWRARRRQRWTALGSAAAVLPWLAWSSMAARSWADDPILGYYTDYLGWWFSCGLSGILRVADQNRRWVAAGIPTTLERLSERLLSLELARLWYPLSL